MEEYSLKKRISLYRDFLKDLRVRHFASDLTSLIYPENPVVLKEVRHYWKKFLAIRPKDQTLNFYIHVPFCSDSCSYCYCPSEKLVNSKDGDVYIGNIVEYFRYFKRTFAGTSFTNLYIGGGTPSVLSENNLAYLLENLFLNFIFDDDGERTCEMDPVSVSPEKMAILRKYGFNRISFGVQSLDKKVLVRNNRGQQTFQAVKEAIGDAQKAGFQKINTDLIVGLAGDTAETFIKSFSTLTKLAPFSVSVYPLQPMPGYIKEFFHCDEEKYLAYRNKLVIRIFKKLGLLAAKNGYSSPQDPDMFLPMNDVNCWSYHKIDAKTSSKKYYLAKSYKEILAVLGLGTFSMSAIPHEITYQMSEPINATPSIYSCSGRISSPRIGMIERIIQSFTYNQYLDCSRFKKDFHIDFFKAFKNSLNDLKNLRAVERRGDRLYLLSGDSDERVLHMLFFFDSEDVLLRIKEAEKRQGAEKEIRGESGFEEFRPSKRALAIEEKLEKMEEAYLACLGGSREILDGEIIKINKRSLTLLLGNKKIQKIEFFPKVFWVKLFLGVDGEEGSYQEEIKMDTIGVGDLVSIIAVPDGQKGLKAAVIREIIVIRQKGTNR